MLWRPAAMAAGARWPGGGGARGRGGRIGVVSFAALQLLLLSTRPWAFMFVPSVQQHQHHPQRRGFSSASSTARHALYTNDGLLPRLPPGPGDWVRALT